MGTEDIPAAVMLVSAAALVALLACAAEARTGYIVGGIDVKIPGTHPWQISLQQRQQGRSGYDHVCGGSIISEYWIVTAAHCLAGSVHSYLVKAGIHDLAQELHKDVQEIRVAKYVLHPEWKESYVEGEGQFPNDIAVIRLASPIKFNKFAQPIKMAKEAFPVGTTCKISGWGYVEGRWGWLDQPNLLQEAKTVLISNSRCKMYWDYEHGMEMIAPNHQCVKSPASACMGDSGGPLVCKLGGENILAGATSWGHPHCTKDKPQMYTRIEYYYEWISKTTRVY